MFQSIPNKDQPATSNHLTKDFTWENFVAACSNQIDAWIQTKMTTKNIHSFSQIIDDLSVPPELLTLISEHVYNIQCHLESINKDLGSMFDNYTCFDGETDHKQMTRFSNSIHQECVNRWNRYESKLPDIHKRDDFINDAFCRMLCLYESDNNKIVENETKIIEEVCTRLVQEHDHIISQFKRENCSTEYIAEAATCQLQRMHDNIAAHSVGVLSRLFDYDGKLNNVVTSYINKTQHAMGTSYRITLTLTTSLSKLITEPTQYDQVIHEYVKDVRIDDSFSDAHFDYDKLLRTHDKLVKKVTSGVKSHVKKDLEMLVNSVFAGIIENKFFESVADENSAACETLIYYLDMNHIWICCVENEHQVSKLNFKNPSTGKNDNLPSYIGLKKSGKILLGFDVTKFSETDKRSNMKHYGKLLDYILKTSPNTGNVAVLKMIADAFSAIKRTAENPKNPDKVRKQYFKTALIVPNWLTSFHRKILREACQIASFKSITIVNASYLVAYYAVKKLETKSDKCFVMVVNIRETEVGIEIFNVNLEKRGVIQLAGAYENWVALPCTKIKVASDEQVNSAKNAWKRVLAQLHLNNETNIKDFVVIAEHENWKEMLNCWLLDTMKVDKIESLTAESLRETLEPFADGSGSFQKKLLGLSGLQISQENNNLGSIKEVFSIVNNSLPKTSKHADELIKKCISMEHQIANGKVVVGPLTKKVILKAIETAKLAASENMVTGEVEHINNLFKIHKFH